jgi:hypothetical protein
MEVYPVRVSARHDVPPNRWLWLIKWVLLVPHYIVLAGLWTGFALALLIAYVAVLTTGRYPAKLFAFSVGVLRWTWRVVYYGYVVLGTDRYPPFTLKAVPGYPADMHIDTTMDRHRWLPLVAWLLAVPHAMILSSLLNTHLVRIIQIHPLDLSIVIPVGVTSIGITVVATQLAITGQHPRGLYDLFTGVARWSLRLAAYVALLTDVYPPFRLDQGPAEPGADHADVASPSPTMENQLTAVHHLRPDTVRG